MVWDQLSINKPHLTYMILGGFTSLFMLCSLFVKEKLYIGEATVATICGIIFGPHAANLIDPSTWGNADQITLEFSRIVLVVQCFAVGVELPKSYMERHWRSVVFLLIPVMTFGWLITSLFVWWMIEPLTWLESLCVAACVTATDPVLASSVVGKGKFAKRVPKHLRDLLSAESGCNDGMAFPFLYLAIYLLRYRPHASKVAYKWICLTILYECIWGAVYGFLIGYFARHAIKWAERKALIDRESFLVFYFVLALFCAGSGSLLGLDDLLVGFAAGVGFSNDGWFTQKTEESHVSNVIDLLLNLAYFVYLGTIIPWQQYNAPELGTTPWRLVVISIFVILFRRIPIMLALKPTIPDVKTWREALFAGHFGPIGVGAIFVAILARAELETDSTTPLAVLPPPGSEYYALVELIWPITTFLVISSILVHGSSIAVFTLGKRINTLTITMSYTQVNEDGPSWMNRLPRIQSVAKNSMSKSKDDYEGESLHEKVPEYPPGTLPPIGMPGNFLRRQKEEDNPSNPNSRTSSVRPVNRRKRWDSGMGPGGPISQSAIAPKRRAEVTSPADSPSDTLNEKSESPDSRDRTEEPDGLELQEAADKKHHGGKDFTDVEEPEVEAFQEGSTMIIEDEEGNVLSQEDTHDETEGEKNQHIVDQVEKLRAETSGEHAKGKYHPHEKNEGEEMMHAIDDGLHHPSHPYQNLKKKLGAWHGLKRNQSEAGPSAEKLPPERKRGPAHAYQFGNTIIVEDEDGEVVKKYELPTPEKRKRGNMNRRGSSYADPTANRQRLHRMGTWVGIGAKDGQGAETEAGPSGETTTKEQAKKRKKSTVLDEDDDRIRFTVNAGGRRMNKEDFIRQIQQLDPKAQCEAIQDSNVPEEVKKEAREHAREHSRAEQSSKSRSQPQRQQSKLPKSDDKESPAQSGGKNKPEIQRVGSDPDRAAGPDGLTLVDSHGEDIPYHSVPESVAKYSSGQESAAQRRRDLASSRQNTKTEEQTPVQQATHPSTLERRVSHMAEAGETRAERRRRLAALGGEDESDSDDDGAPRRPRHAPVPEPGPEDGDRERERDRDRDRERERERERRAPGVRFADTPAVSQGRVQWGEDVGRLGRRA
ncbi:hypothetical protein MMC16_002917 [Acarospora aff. strigata]|nr:hypothetical protein [Acarospora aff. strigata]